eukprot:c1343_g1_i1.p1 GENE.c1343_g1_i1~~c1343_g1_i1.p1  ORF type:complete len:551 (+),score=96.79 c1343_g1_i1:36-1688(+)
MRGVKLDVLLSAQGADERLISVGSAETESETNLASCYSVLRRLPTFSDLSTLKTLDSWRFQCCSVLFAFCLCQLCDSMQCHFQKDCKPRVPLEDAVLLFSLGASCLFTAYLMHNHDIPKTTEEILKLFFSGFGEKSIMVSYSHKFGAHAREIPKMIPQCWLDIKDLFPGEITSEACVRAAENAAIRLVFLDENYFASESCRLEFNVCCTHPPADTLFYYDPALEGSVEIRSLHESSFNVCRLPPSPKYFDANFVLSSLIKHNILPNAFQKHSPPLNEDWRATASALLALRSRKVTIQALLPVLLCLAINLAVILFAASTFLQHAGVLVLQVTMFAIATIALAIAPVPGLFRFAIHSVDSLALVGAPHLTLPDVAWFMVILKKMMIIKQPVPLYVPEEVVQKSAAVFSFLQHTKVVLLCNSESCDARSGVKCVSLDDNNVHLRQLPPNPRTLYYSRERFTNLKSSLSPSFQYTYIARGVPDIEMVLVHILRIWLNWNQSTITPGSRGFQCQQPQDTPKDNKLRMILRKAASVIVVVISVLLILVTQSFVWN